jgi:urease accessory protein
MALLLLADGRTPSGGHAHSGGVEPAVMAGEIATTGDLEAFLCGRLATTGLVAAAFAGAACAVCADRGDGVLDTLSHLDEELDARTPSPAQRAASRAQGRSLLRAARAAWPELRSPVPAPHHAVALGIAAEAAGLEPADAALAAAYGAVSGPASAATRLLGLDPLAVTALLARMGSDVEAVTAAAVASATEASGTDYRSLPALTAVRLDLLAEAHRTAEVRMFAS